MFTYYRIVDLLHETFESVLSPFAIDEQQMNAEQERGKWQGKTIMSRADSTIFVTQPTVLRSSNVADRMQQTGKGLLHIGTSARGEETPDTKDRAAPAALSVRGDLTAQR